MISLLSRMIVVGPSLISETFIIAPKIPVSVWTPAFSNALLKYSYNGFDISGLAASKKLGLLPFLQFAYKVNCEIERISPLISINDKFNFSFSSSKILKLISLLMVHAQDHLMTSLLCIDLAQEFVDVYKKIG